MSLMDAPAQGGPGRVTKVLEKLTPEELEAAVKRAVEDSREEVERLTRPYREGWRRTRELCAPFWGPR